MGLRCEWCEKYLGRGHIFPGAPRHLDLKKSKARPEEAGTVKIKDAPAEHVSGRNASAFAGE